MQNNIKMQKTHPNSQCSCEWGQHWALYWGWDCYWDFSEQVKQTSFRNSTNKANPASRHWAALRTLETPFPGVLGICFPLPERSCCALQGEAERPQLLPSIPHCLCWEWQDGDREFRAGSEHPSISLCWEMAGWGQRIPCWPRLIHCSNTDIQLLAVSWCSAALLHC